MMKLLSVSAAVALAFAGAAHATPQDPPADDGFNLMMPGDDLESSDDGWNLGVEAEVTEDGFVIPDGVVEDRLGDVAEIETGASEPDLSADLPVIKEAEDDVIRLN